MKQSLKTSLVLASFNGQQFIEEQLLSILKQTHTLDEVIILDDCSSDNTMKKIDSFIAEHHLNTWKVIKNLYNKGFVSNFLDGIEYTTGDVIFFADQDDIFLKDKFEVILNIFAKHPECLVLNTGYEFITSTGKVKRGLRALKHFSNNRLKRIDFNHFLYNSNYPGFAMAIRREIVGKVLKFKSDENVYGHDILLNLLGIAENGTFYVDKKLSYYRIHSQNVTGGENIMNSWNIQIRLNQKQRELSEYNKLKKICAQYQIKNINILLIDKRMTLLRKRIDVLNTKCITKSLKLLVNKEYPVYTMMGDVLFILNHRLRRLP